MKNDQIASSEFMLHCESLFEEPRVIQLKINRANQMKMREKKKVIRRSVL